MMEEIIAQIESLASSADEGGRRKIQEALREVQYSLETPYDTLLRFANLHPQIASARIGVDLGLFNALAQSESPLSLDILAEKSGAAPELLGRIMRYLASVGIVTESGKDEFVANNITKVLSQQNYQGGIYHAFDNWGPCFQELPDFFVENKYQNITDNTKTAFNKAFKTDLSIFAWLPNQPERFLHFQQAMKIQRTGDWLSVFSVEDEVGSWSPEPDKILFVDVAGGFGHQCVGLKAKYPKLPGRVILQDLPETLAHVQPIEGVEIMAQNFYEPQPIKGAKFYYLRTVLHDYPDDKCIMILKNLIPAMDKDSRILIDEMVLPNSGVHWQVTAIDFMMMAALGSQERTKEQWHVLMEKAGLRILETHTYNSWLHNSVMVVQPKEPDLLPSVSSIEMKSGRQAI